MLQTRRTAVATLAGAAALLTTAVSAPAPAEAAAINVLSHTLAPVIDEGSTVTWDMTIRLTGATNLYTYTAWSGDSRLSGLTVLNPPSEHWGRCFPGEARDCIYSGNRADGVHRPTFTFTLSGTLNDDVDSGGRGIRMVSPVYELNYRDDQFQWWENRVDVEYFLTNVTVRNVAPEITGIDADRTTLKAGESLSVSALARDRGQDTLSYSWDMDGDGLYDDLLGWAGDYTFDQAGTYTISARVSDDDGGVTTRSMTVTVLPGAVTEVAEPAPLAMMGLGLLMVGALRRRRH